MPDFLPDIGDCMLGWLAKCMGIHESFMLSLESPERAAISHFCTLPLTLFV